MARRSNVLAFVAAHTLPDAVAAAADLLATTAPQGDASHAEVVEWAFWNNGVTPRIAAFLADRDDTACATAKQWARLCVVLHTTWWRGLESRLRHQVAVDLVGPCAYNAYIDWAVENVLKAA